MFLIIRVILNLNLPITELLLDSGDLFTGGPDLVANNRRYVFHTVRRCFFEEMVEISAMLFQKFSVMCHAFIISHDSSPTRLIGVSGKRLD
jgi:hypothetical protein